MLDKATWIKRRRRKKRIRQLTAWSVVFLFFYVCITGARFIFGAIFSTEEEGEYVDSDELNYIKSDEEKSSDYNEKQSSKKNSYRIVVDAGHGGIDPGSDEGGIYERDLNFSIAKVLKQYLENSGYEVIMTREEDVKIALSERVAITNRSNADLFISIHQNSSKEDSSIHGIETWYNDTIHSKNKSLAEYIQKAIVETTGGKDRGIKNGSLEVLDGSNVPACLIETGFITNEQERNLLNTKSYQEKIAQGIVNALKQYFEINGQKQTNTSNISSGNRENSQITTNNNKTDSITDSITNSNLTNNNITNNHSNNSDGVSKEKEYIPQKEGDKIVYITFDDGPCKTTPKLLDLLDELNIKVTFFVTAQYSTGDKLKQQLKEISDRGHTIGVHSYSHKYKDIYQSVDSYIQDYLKMDDIIAEATGTRSNIFRFPGGSNTGYNKTIRDELITEMNNRGYTYYDWNAFDGDTEKMSKSQMLEKAVKESSYKDKTILLMHDTPGKETVLEILPKIVEQLKQKGYRFAPLDDTIEPIQFIKLED